MRGWGHSPVAHGHQGASRSCQRTCFLASSEVAMVTEAGGDTRWSGPSQIIFPSSSLFQVLVRAGVGSARDGGEDKMQRQDPGYKLCVHGGGKLSWDGVCVCVGGCWGGALLLRVCSGMLVREVEWYLGSSHAPVMYPSGEGTPTGAASCHQESPPLSTSWKPPVCCLDHSSCHKPL